MEELPTIVGIRTTDKSFKDYLWQQLCKAMCYKPETPLDDISDMVKANAQFRCQNDQIKIHGENPNEILTSWNSQVQKPECEVVHNTIVCVVDALEKSVYVNIFLQNCAITYHFYVVDAIQTFGNLQCHLKHVTIVNNFFESDLSSNANTNQKKKIFLAPKAEGGKIVAYEKLNHAMLAAQNFDQYKEMLRTWQELCGEDTGHDTSSMCKSVTRNMTKVCKRLRTQQDNNEISQIGKCLQKKYSGLEKKTQAEIDLWWCRLKKRDKEPDMKECQNSISTPETPNEGGDWFAFIWSIGNSISHMGQAVCEFLRTAWGAVSWVWNWVAWVFWNIGVYIPSCRYVIENIKGCVFIGSVSGLVYYNITTSLRCADGYTKCNSFKDCVFTSIFLVCFGLQFLAVKVLFSVINFFLDCMGLNQRTITELKDSCSEFKSGCVQLKQGLEHAENLEVSVNSIHEKYAELEAQIKKRTHKQTTPEIHPLRDTQAMRRRRETEDANTQRMHVDQQIEHMMRTRWGKCENTTTPEEVDDWGSSIEGNAARGRSDLNAHRQGMHAYALPESLDPF